MLRLAPFSCFQVHSLLRNVQFWLLGREEGLLVPSYLRNANFDPLENFPPFFALITRFERAYERAQKYTGCCARHESSVLRPLQLV